MRIYCLLTQEVPHGMVEQVAYYSGKPIIDDVHRDITPFFSNTAPRVNIYNQAKSLFEWDLSLNLRTDGVVVRKIWLRSINLD